MLITPWRPVYFLRFRNSSIALRISQETATSSIWISTPSTPQISFTYREYSFFLTRYSPKRKIRASDFGSKLILGSCSGTLVCVYSLRIAEGAVGLYCFRWFSQRNAWEGGHHRARLNRLPILQLGGRP